MSRPHVIIAAVASALIVLIAAVGRLPNYRVAPALLLPLLWGAVALRRRLHLRPLPLALFAAALVLHMLGAFGFYQRAFFGLSFDIYVHFYFAFAGAVVLHGFFAHAVPPDAPRWAVDVTTLRFMMGFGALHEIMEYGTYLALGEQRGMLKPSTSYFFDTQRDLLNNLLGTLTALVLTALVRAAARSDAERIG